MTDQSEQAKTDDAAQARERIEDARSEAAAYVVQRQPLEPASGSEVGGAEERIVEAVEEARDEQDPDALEDLAEQAESGRDRVRRQLYGRGTEDQAGN